MTRTLSSRNYLRSEIAGYLRRAVVAQFQPVRCPELASLPPAAVLVALQHACMRLSSPDLPADVRQEAQEVREAALIQLRDLTPGLSNL